MDDLEQLHRYVANSDKDAISSVIRKYQKMVFSACLRRLGCAADAEDATQQVFIAMMQSAAGISTSVRQWLYRCSLNVSASVIRSRKSRIHREREKARHAKAWCGNGEAERNETYAILMQCLGDLNATDQKVLVDNQVNGVTQQALASSMGVTQQAVAKRLGKIILHLRRELTSRGVIFSLVAAVLLSAKRAAAVIPEGIKAAMTSAPSATLATGGAGAGSAGVLKVGTATVLVMVAVATYECAHERPSNSSNKPVGTVHAVSAERSVSAGNVAVPDFFRGNIHIAAPIALNGLPGQTVQPFRQAFGPAASSATATSDLPASRHRFDVALNRRAQQELPAGPQNDPDRPYLSLSSAAFWGTSFGRQCDSLAAKTENGKKPGTDGSKVINPSSLDALAGDLSDLARGDSADELAPSDASSFEEGNQRDGRRMAFMNRHRALRANIGELDMSRAWTKAIDLDAGFMKGTILSASLQQQYTGVKRWSVTAVDEPIDEVNLGYSDPVKLIGDLKLSDLASLFPISNTNLSHDWTRSSRPSLDDSSSSGDSLSDTVEPTPSPAKLTLLPTALQPAAAGILPSFSKAITVPAGAELPVTGTLDGRLINQGTVVAASGDEPLYLAGLVSGAGSYKGNVVFAGGFSPGNSPAEIYVDCAVLDGGNVLTMELSGLTPGKQYDQIIIGDHLALGGYLDVELIYGFMPKLGDSFTLFDGDFSGKFSGVTLPALDGGLHWDTGGLYTDGSLQVVPEPATLFLLTAGGVGLLRRHRPA